MTEQRDYKMRTLITTGQDGFYRMVLEGEATLAELRECLTQLAVFADTRKELWVISDLSVQITTPEIVSLAKQVKTNAHRPEMVAIVADNDLLYGLSRIFSGHREDSQTRIQVFRDESRALNWLDSSHIALPAAEDVREDAWQYFHSAGDSC